MNARRMLQVGLLVVLGVTVAFLVMPRADRSSTDANSDAGTAIAGDHAFAVYYLHGDRRCETCVSIERQTETAVRSAFAAELEAGTLIWAAVNTDKPENAHFNEQFGLTHSTVILVERNADRIVRFEKLDDVWELVFADDGELGAYVQREVGAWLRPTTTSR